MILVNFLMSVLFSSAVVGVFYAAIASFKPYRGADRKPYLAVSIEPLRARSWRLWRAWDEAVAAARGTDWEILPPNDQDFMCYHIRAMAPDGTQWTMAAENTHPFTASA
jgi:hypothetical protein